MAHTNIRPAMLALSLLAASAAQATPVTGRLEIQWGDPASGHGALTQLQVTLLGDDGKRTALDPRQSLAAAEDLYALGGRRVAVAFAPVAKGRLPYSIDAIVPTDGKSVLAGQKAVNGTTVWRTLMCKFSDIATEQKPLSFFQGQYGSGVGQLDNYWREVSYDKVNLTGSTASGWYTLPHPRSYYVTQVDGQDDANLNGLFDDCVAAANATVDFAAGGAGVQGINMMFNGDLDGYAWGGGRCATLDGVNKCWSTTWNPPWSFNNLAPLAHEMGHGYGLPHANNSDLDSDPYDNPWDVMSSAWNNAVNDATYGTRAKHLSTYSRDRLGWIDAARKLEMSSASEAVDIPLDRASLSGSTQRQMIVVRVPGQPTSKYYTIEARKRVGNYEGNLAGDAVIIHSVDTSRGEPAWSVDTAIPPANVANNEGSMFKVGEGWVAPGNAFRVRVTAATAEGFLVSVCPYLTGPHHATSCELVATGPVVRPPRGRPLVPGVPTFPPCNPAVRQCP